MSGGRWATDSVEINAAEAQAVSLALSAFHSHWIPGSSVTLRIDNTSALSAVKRRRADSEGVSFHLADILAKQKLYDVAFDASYVRSSENVSDFVSRLWRRGG